MLDPTILTKITTFLQVQLIDELNLFHDKLVLGELADVEEQLDKTMRTIYDEVMGVLLPSAAEVFSNEYKAPKGSKPTKSPHGIKIATGTTVNVSSPYLKNPPETCSNARRPLLGHWNVTGGNSLGLCDRTAYLSVLASSFHLSNQALKKFGTQLSESTTRKLTLDFADKCQEIGEENLIVQEGWTLAGKSVVISVDGGRTRTREYTGEKTAQGTALYNTPWREPKLFVIDILDSDGRPDRYEFPLYGCRFSDEDMLLVLRKYLAKLKVEQASSVQLIADGASWIWNQIPTLLLDLGVPEERLVESIDYYHTTGYVYKLVEAMPRRIGKKKRSEHTKQLKEMVKAGQIDAVLTLLKEIFLRPSPMVKRWMNYFEKHKNRMQYADFQRKGLMRGSGIIESAVRRIINLRFKNAATFWLPENVEKLYFLRGMLLSGRWKIFMTNMKKT